MFPDIYKPEKSEIEPFWFTRSSLKIHSCRTKIYDFSGSPTVNSALPMQGAQVSFLVGGTKISYVEWQGQKISKIKNKIK